MQPFTLLSYNILSGSFENYEATSKLSSRFDYLLDKIKESNFNFVGLIDTFKWKKCFTENELKKKFGYKHAIDMEDTRVDKEIGVAVLTNLDVKEFNVVRAYNRNYIETVLNDLHIYTVYLDDLSEDTRLNEMQSLIEHVKFPAIIHGDLNTVSLNDVKAMEPLEKEFEAKNKELSKTLIPIINDMKRGEVIQLLEQSEFKDAFQSFEPTLPTPIFPANTTEPIIRLDYILYSEGIRVSKQAVLQNKDFDMISDHYPISATIELN